MSQTGQSTPNLPGIHFRPAPLFARLSGVACLPIIDRELRVAARHWGTWWRRVLVAAAALVLFFFLYANMSRYRTPASISREMFSVIGALACVYAMLAGPFSTVDCVSKEKREGTLGLLFLTDLTAFDVVLGKIFAASLDLALGIVAVVPVLAIPFMMGGVSLSQFLVLAASTAVLLALSLAVGILVSSLSWSGRIALGITIAALLFLTFVPVFIGDAFRVYPNHKLAPLLFAICPAYTFVVALDTPRRLGLAGVLWHFSCLTFFAGWLVFVACYVTRRAWREATMPRRWQFLSKWCYRRSPGRSRWRARMLSAHPLTWLEGRTLTQSRALWTVVWLSTGFWVVAHVFNPRQWPDTDAVILWPMFSHFTLCLWIAIDAPRRFSDDKHSGALELLLCAPYPPSDIVRDAMRALRQRFIGPLIVLMALAGYSVLFFVSSRGRPGMTDELLRLAFGGLLVIPAQAYVFARVGLYQGLVSKTSLRATFMIIAKLFVLPWVLFFAWVIFTETFRGSVPGFLRGPDAAFAVWPVAHLLPFAIFLSHANARLAADFRTLAAYRG